MTISYYEKMGGKVVNIDDEIPFELPESWAWCRGYSCFEGLGSTKPQGDFFDYIDIDAIDNRLHCIKDAKHLPVSDAPSLHLLRRNIATVSHRPVSMSATPTVCCCPNLCFS